LSPSRETVEGANKVPGRFLDEEDIIVVLLRLKKSISQHIVLMNILQINA